MCRSACIKYLVMFRTQLPHAALSEVLQPCVNLLKSPNVVVRSYAAHAIERMCMIKHHQEHVSSVQAFGFSY